MSIFYLLVFAFGLMDSAWWRWADNRAKRGLDSRFLRIVLAVFTGSQLLYLAYFIFFPKSARRVHPWIPMPFIASVYIWHLLILPASGIAIGIGKLARWLNGLIKKSHPHSSDLETAGGPTFTRRQALTAAALVTPPFITTLAVARAMPQLDHFRIRQMHLVIPGLPLNLDGLRIAHVTDIHVGRYTRRGTLPKIVEATNQLKADLVLFTGDLIDLSLDDLDRGLDAMKKMDPRHGLVMIQGNHDLIENPQEFNRRTKASGLPLLVDETHTFTVRNERVQLLGMRWGFAPGKRRKPADLAYTDALNVLLPQKEEGAFPILLAHHPHAFDAAAAAGLPLTLSGHTHGGQLMLDKKIGFGPLFFRYWSGPYQKENSQMVVSNGVGNWFPLRINAPAEIVDLTLHAGS